MSPSRPTDETECPDLGRWTSEGGAVARVKEPVEASEVLETLDFFSAKLAGFPHAGRLAADLAARIRVRGLNPSAPYGAAHSDAESH
jgi:hypothetical protein